jgi:phospholipase/lecithinase/hemolysin
MRILAKTAIIAAAICLGTAPPAAAGSISAVIAFGDSNVDNGNLRARGLQFGLDINPPPNFGGRNSNGPVVVEYLADLIHRPLVNNAFSGANTGTGLNFGIATNTLSQIQLYLAARAGSADPRALYVYWAGSNDLLGVGGDAALLQQRVTAARANIEAGLTALSDAGASRIIVANRTPRPDLASQDNLNGLALNAMIADLVADLDPLLGADLLPFDNYSLIADMVTNGTAYGFTRTAAGDLCFFVASCNADLTEAVNWTNWDAAHKTTRVHELMAQAIVEQFELPVPAPPALALFIPALGLLLVARRRADGDSRRRADGDSRRHADGHSRLPA